MAAINNIESAGGRSARPSPSPHHTLDQGLTARFTRLFPPGRDSGMRKRGSEPALSFSLLDYVRRPAPFSIVPTDQELETSWDNFNWTLFKKEYGLDALFKNKIRRSEHGKFNNTKNDHR